MDEPLVVPFAGGPVYGRLRPPGSKSLTNRALALAGFADGVSLLRHALFSEDSLVMVGCLGALGVHVRMDEHAGSMQVHGCHGLLSASEAELDCRLSGTTLRFLMAMCGTQAGWYRFDGTARMRQRPVGELGTALAALGCEVRYEQAQGFVPLQLSGSGMQGGEVEFVDPPSSQVVSALLMAGAMSRSDLFVSVRGDLPSAPYVSMTLSLLERFGVQSVGAMDQSSRYVVPGQQRISAVDLVIEPDASSASYFLAAAAAVGGEVRIEGVGTSSLQGDAGFARVLGLMGCEVEQEAQATVVRRDPRRRLVGVDVDLNAMPDMAQTLAVLALLAEGPTVIRNVSNLAIKETDRLTAVTQEARKLGGRVEQTTDGWRIEPPERLVPAVVESWGDHRMAMAFSVAGLACEGVAIAGWECVGKTYPGFFDDLGRLVRGDFVPA